MTQQFEPFQKVLVRDTDNQKWRCGFFSNIIDEGTRPMYRATESVWHQCIPYEGNEHLLGTKDSPTPPEPEFKFGDKVEVSNDRIDWYKAIYLHKSTDDRHFLPRVVVVHENSSSHKEWTYCRKADW